MAKIEREVEDRFFDIITNQAKNPTSNAYKVYQKLVYMRYEEIINNTFPQFIKHISKEELDKTIYEFLKEPPKTPFVWQIANDYRKMVKKQKLFHDRKYLYDLLYIDWIEVEVLMKDYDFKKVKDFSWSKKYKISPSARVKTLKYDVLSEDFHNRVDNHIVVYYDFETDEVVFRHLNDFLYFLLKKVNKKKLTLQKVLKDLCKINSIDLKEAKGILEEPLSELIDNRVLIKS